MVELSLPNNSKIIQGKVFGKKTNESICFNIYRWNRESGSNPRVDKFFIPKKKLGPMALDALLFIKNEIESRLGLGIEIVNKKNNSGKVVIKYKSLEQFELISKKLMR